MTETRKMWALSGGGYIFRMVRLWWDWGPVQPASWPLVQAAEVAPGSCAGIKAAVSR